MRIIHVVIVKEDVVYQIDSFPIYEEQMSETRTDEAEALFLSHVREFTDQDLDSEDVGQAITDGAWVGSTWSINICWSYAGE